MATAEEKAAKQAAKDVARQSVVAGQQRLATEVPKAATAFPQRRLRTAGDLSRYAIGGFTDDPYALDPAAGPVPGSRGAKPVKLPSAASGSGVSGGRTVGQTPTRTTTQAGQLASRHGLSPAETRFLDRRAAGPSAEDLRTRARSSSVTAAQTQQLAQRAGLAPAEVAFQTKHAAPYAQPAARTPAPAKKPATRGVVGGKKKAAAPPRPKPRVSQTGLRATAI